MAPRRQRSVKTDPEFSDKGTTKGTTHEGCSSTSKVRPEHTGSFSSGCSWEYITVEDCPEDCQIGVPHLHRICPCSCKKRWIDFQSGSRCAKLVTHQKGMRRPRGYCSRHASALSKREQKAAKSYGKKKCSTRKRGSRKTNPSTS